MKIYAFIINALTAFMAVGTQFGMDRYKMMGRKFSHKRIQRKLNSDKVINLTDFGVYLRKLKKF